MEDFERDLRQAFERRPAPPGLKRKLMEKRRAHGSHRPDRPHRPSHFVLWQRLAASLALVAVLGGAAAWRNVEERRKGEEARRQVLTALRITSHALNQMNAQLAAHDRAAQE
jgi:hypothetical protein